MDAFLISLALEVHAPCPFFSEVIVVVHMGDEVFSCSEIKRDDESLYGDRSGDLGIVSATSPHADEGIDGDLSGEVFIVGDGQEGTYIVLVEMQVETACLVVDVGNVGQEGIRQVVPVGGSDLGVNHTGRHTAGHWSISEGLEADRGTEGVVCRERSVDEGASEGELEEGHEDKQGS